MQLLIDAADKDKASGNESSSNETNLSNSSTLKKSTGAGYLTSKGAEKSGNNTKKYIKAAKRSDYLTSGTGKTFNLLWHAFI